MFFKHTVLWWSLLCSPWQHHFHHHIAVSVITEETLHECEKGGGKIKSEREKERWYGRRQKETDWWKEEWRMRREKKQKKLYSPVWCRPGLGVFFFWNHFRLWFSQTIGSKVINWRYLTPSWLQCALAPRLLGFVCALSSMTPVYRVCLTIERPTLGGISRIKLYVAFEGDVLDVGLANLVNQSTE